MRDSLEVRDRGGIAFSGLWDSLKVRDRGGKAYSGLWDSLKVRERGGKAFSGSPQRWGRCADIEKDGGNGRQVGV